MQRSFAQPASSPYSGDNRAVEHRDPRTEYALCRLAAVLLDIARNPRRSEAVSVTSAGSATVVEGLADAEAAADEPVRAGELRPGQEEAANESVR
jgi:hypothetical protein